MANGINAPFGLSPYISNVGKADITKMTPYNIPCQVNANGNTTTWNQSIFAGDPVAFSGVGTAAQAVNENTDNGIFVGLNAANNYPLTTSGAIVNVNAYGNFVSQGVKEGSIWSGSLYSSNATAQVVGVGISARYNNPNNIYNVEYPFWPANTQVQTNVPPTMYVNDDPQALFTVQCSTSNGNIADAIFTWDMIGQNVQLNVGGVAFNAPNVGTILEGFIAAPNPVSGNTITGNSAFYADLSTITTAGNANPNVGAMPNKNVTTSLVNANLTSPGEAYTNYGPMQQNNYYANFKILGVILPTNLNNIGNQNTLNASIINKLTPGVNMPFMTVFGKINNHVYGSPSYSTVTSGGA